MLGASAARLAAREVEFEVTDAAVALLAERGYEPEYGARPLRRVIQREIDDRTRGVTGGRVGAPAGASRPDEGRSLVDGRAFVVSVGRHAGAAEAGTGAASTLSCEPRTTKTTQMRPNRPAVSSTTFAIAARSRACPTPVVLADWIATTHSLALLPAHR